MVSDLNNGRGCDDKNEKCKTGMCVVNKNALSGNSEAGVSTMVCGGF